MKISIVYKGLYNADYQTGAKEYHGASLFEVNETLEKVGGVMDGPIFIPYHNVLSIREEQ